MELSHDGAFELADVDADRVVRRTARDVLWQKERLLNVGVAALPRSCRNVVWLDADVLFARDDWHVEASRLLQDQALVQLFHRFRDLPRGAVAPAADAAATYGHAFVHLLRAGGHEARLFESKWWSGPRTMPDGSTRVERRVSSGFAWAGRRDVLERFGLYDACIVGSGDRAIACAAAGRAATATQSFLRTDAQRRHYLAWAEPFAAAVAGRISFVEGDLYHLWHGELRDRGWRARWRDLAGFGFDPFTDIAIDERGCWRWSSRKPAMHAHVRRYFEGRREDGPENVPSCGHDAR